jgi:excisionase family DNA binding protein
MEATGITSSTNWQEDRLMKVEDIAFYLNTSLSYAYRLIQSGALRSVKIGRCVRVHPQDLHEYIQQNLQGRIGTIQNS